MFNIKKKSSNSKSCVQGLQDSIHHLMASGSNGSNIVDKAQILMYLQKTICNSIVYSDYVYKVLRNPHSAPHFGLSDFLPRNDNYRYFDLENDPIYLNSNDVAFITLPWNNRKIIDGIRAIGSDVGNPFDTTNSNIDNVYIYPLGIVLVASSGNHSQFIGLLKGELSKIKVNRIYDISEELVKDNDNQFTNFYGASEGNALIGKWQSLMEIGKYLLKHNEFPPSMLEHMKNEGMEENSKEVVSMTYKDRVLTEFSNTAYRRVTGTRNFDNVPKAIWDLWYDENNKYSVQNLSKANADDSKWETLYGMFQKEFAKLN